MPEESAVAVEARPVCGGCGGSLIRAGKRPNGVQRWSCKACGRYVDGPRAELVGRKAVEQARDAVLTAYRHVLENAAEFDQGGLEVMAREIRVSDPKQFEKRYRELESEERAGSAKLAVDVSANVAEDVGEVRARELLGRLLSEWSETQTGG